MQLPLEESGPRAETCKVTGTGQTPGEVASEAGLHEDALARLWAASGLGELEGQPLAPGDATVARSFAAMVAALGEDAALGLVAATGAALTRAAEAAVTASLRATPGMGAGEVGAHLSALAAHQLRHHVALAARRLGADQAAAADQTLGLCSLTIGFVDLVGSTAWARRLGPEGWADTMEAFGVLAGDVAAERQVQLVKFVGDGVMLVAREPRSAVLAALDLVEACGFARSLPPARAGLAFGSVAVRSGDYHGPVVALCARIAERAGPGQVLVPDELAERLGPGPVGFATAGRHCLRGFDAPVRLVALVRNGRPAQADRAA